MRIHSVAIDILTQMKSAVSQIQDEEYQQVIPQMSGATIGQHVRHTLEFFECLLTSVNGEVNYDMRKREYSVESSRVISMNMIEKLISDLQQNISDKEMILLTNPDPIENESIRIHTSFERELAYNVEHAIHHMALIKLAIQFLGLTVLLPESFGVASSTVRYRQQN